MGIYRKGETYQVGCHDETCSKAFEWRPTATGEAPPQFCPSCRIRRRKESLSAHFAGRPPL